MLAYAEMLAIMTQFLKRARVDFSVILNRFIGCDMQTYGLLGCLVRVDIECSCSLLFIFSYSPLNLIEIVYTMWEWHQGLEAKQPLNVAS